MDFEGSPMGELEVLDDEPKRKGKWGEEVVRCHANVFAVVPVSL